MATGIIEGQFEAGGKSYRVRLSVKALGALQHHYGLQSIDEVDAKLLAFSQTSSVDDMVAILWASLRSHHPDVGKDQVLDMLDEIGLAESYRVIRDVFAASRDPSEEDAAGTGDDRP